MPTRHLRRCAPGALVVLAVAFGASGARADAPATCQPSATISCPPAPAVEIPAPDEILSNETTFTTWASSLTPSPVRAQPSASSARVATLRASTEDGFPEIYIVLRQRHVDSRTWAQVRVPMRPNGATGWVPRDALDTFNRVTTELVLNRATQRIQLYRGGRKVLEAAVGIGKPGTPTPAGHFWIREAFPVRGAASYGPFAFGTSAYSPLTDWPGGGVVGIHGTDQPQLIPGRPSHGCVRLRNADILRLARAVPVGTPLLVK